MSEILKSVILKGTESDLIQIIYELKWDGLFDNWDMDRKSKDLAAIVSHFKLDEKSIRKEAATLIDAAVHHCEVCSCTEKTACRDKCSWAQEFLEAKRYVCSNCTSLAKPIAKKEAKKAAA